MLVAQLCKARDHGCECHAYCHESTIGEACNEKVTHSIVRLLSVSSFCQG